MKKELSILIPTKDYVCTRLIKELVKQATAIQNLIFEIIVADDGSKSEETITENKIINQFPHCKYIIRETNIGRSSIRNFLASQAQYPQILFLDSDVYLPTPLFLQQYIDVIDSSSAVYGGIINDNNRSKWKGNLRYKYEKDSESKHDLQHRQASPYRSFCTPNFLISKDIMLNNPFDETIKAYGYEDVILGRTLEQNGITIKHIENPILICEFEDNKAYLNKIKTALTTLYYIQDKVKNHSQLVVAMNLIKRLHLVNLVSWAFLLIQSKLEKQLIYSKNPSLLLLKLYKIGFFISIQKHQ
ncbi:MAG: glycosyltransferase family 2 protein [Prevotella sp.]